MKQPEQLLRLRVVIEPRAIQRDEQLVRGLQGRQAARLRLALDDVAARRRIREHDPGQPLQAEARAEHRPDKAPGGVQQENDEPPARELRGVELSLREIARAETRIKQHGKIMRIVDQRLHGLVVIEADAEVQLAVAQAEVREPTGVRLHALVLIGVHEKHELRARRHRRDRATPAMAQRPETTVTHFATHERSTIAGPPAHDQSEDSRPPDHGFPVWVGASLVGARGRPKGTPLRKAGQTGKPCPTAGRTSR